MDTTSVEPLACGTARATSSMVHVAHESTDFLGFTLDGWVFDQLGTNILLHLPFSSKASLSRFFAASTHTGRTVVLLLCARIGQESRCPASSALKVGGEVSPEA